MSDEKPVQLKATRKKRKRKRLSTPEKRVCIIHLNNNKSDTEVRPLTQHSFLKIKNVAQLRKNCGNQDDHFNEIITELPEHFDSSLHGNH